MSRMPGNKTAHRSSREDEAPQGAASAPSPSDQNSFESSEPAAFTPVTASSSPFGSSTGGVVSGALSSSSSEPSLPENATTSGGQVKNVCASEADSSRWGKIRESTVRIPASSLVVPTLTIDADEEL